MRACRLSECITLEAALTDRDRAGHVLEAHASPFRKRVSAAGSSVHRQTGTTVLSAPSVTWSALLCAVTSVLKAPRASPAGQVMHSMCVTIPAEHRQAVLSIAHPQEGQDMGSITNVQPNLEGVPIPAAHSAEATGRAAAAQASIIDTLTLQPSDPLVSECPAPDVETSMQLGHPSGDAPQKGCRDSSEPEKAAPARASRRLEARRWACRWLQ